METCALLLGACGVVHALSKALLSASRLLAESTCRGHTFSAEECFQGNALPLYIKGPTCTIVEGIFVCVRVMQFVGCGRGEFWAWPGQGDVCFCESGFK
jgi:hypothetical protein